MTASRRWLTKPGRPTLQRGHPLARGLTFALCPWWLGARSGTAEQTEPDDRTNLRGDIQGSVPGNHSHWDFGRAIAAGVSVDPTRYGQQGVQQATRAGASSQWSAAMLFRVLDIPEPDDALFFYRGDTVLQTESFGFGGNVFGGGLNYEAQSLVRDGGGGSDGNTPSFFGWPGIASVNESYFQMTTWVGTGTFPGQSNNESDQIVDGLSFGNAVPGFPNNIDPTALRAIQLLGDAGGAGNNLDGELAMVAMWNRRLPKSAMQMMYRDPFTLWRPVPEVQGEAEEIVAAAAIADACCC